MTQAQAEVEYGKPQVDEKVNERVGGVLSKIVSYEFIRHSESVPGSNADRSNTTTTLAIRVNSRVTEGLHQVKFLGFVGFELIGQEVHYEDRTIEKTTYFDPIGRENHPSYRRGKKETERVQRLIPTNGQFPIYISKQTSQFTL